MPRPRAGLLPRTGSAWTATPITRGWPTCGGGPTPCSAPHDGGYELRDCWPRHIHAVWELSTLAAEWHHAYGGTRPDLARALEFHDRWLPGTMRRITGITGKCMPQCVMLRGPGDWAARPGYR